jgi:hypothetical protein
MTMASSLLFDGRLGRLSGRDAEYWRMMFSKILKVGEEFEVVVPHNRDWNDVRENFIDAFKPTNSVDVVGENGVHSVVEDGSVRNGLEVVTVGRRFDWNNFMEMNQKIMGKFKEVETSTSYHTGMHIHLLAGYSSYGVSELEKNVPEIILANFYQLHRIFAPELHWVASSGDNDYAITRYNLFRQPPFKFSATNKPMQLIIENLKEEFGKYHMINMNPCVFNGTRELSRFHVELRYPDTHLSPAVSTALVGLTVAMLNKAIDLSQFGIISIKNEIFDHKKKLYGRFVNLGTGERESDSTDLTREDVEELQVMANSMVRWFKPEIMSVSPVAYNILQKMSSTPSSSLRLNGKNWSEIEEFYYSPKVVASQHKERVVQAIILQEIDGLKNGTEWKKAIAGILGISVAQANEILAYVGRERLVVWDSEIGSMTFKQIA